MFNQTGKSLNFEPHKRKSLKFHFKKFHFKLKFLMRVGIDTKIRKIPSQLKNKRKEGLQLQLDENDFSYEVINRISLD